MSAILGFLSFVFWTVVLLAIVMAFLAFRGYNGLRLLSENVKEAWSNIGVTVGKQASLINQLINVVSSYAEGEKLVMLKVSEDASVGAVQQAHQQGGVVLSAVNGMAQRFPDLKANGQYVALMAAINGVEDQLERQRQAYNAATKAYNVRRTSIPDVFYSKLLGFGEAPYLDFDGASEKNAAALQSFASDDGERLNQLLAGASNRVVEASQQVATAAAAHGKQLAVAAKAKVEEVRQRPPSVGSAGSAEATVIAGAAADGDATVLAAKPRVPRLVDVGGTAAGKSFIITPQGITIGRANTAGIPVNDSQVSKQHAWVGQSNGRWVLTDQNSSNGTYLDGDLANRVQEVELKPDLVVALGSHGATRFKVVFD